MELPRPPCVCFSCLCAARKGAASMRKFGRKCMSALLALALALLASVLPLGAAPAQAEETRAAAGAFEVTGSTQLTVTKAEQSKPTGTFSLISSTENSLSVNFFSRTSLQMKMVLKLPMQKDRLPMHRPAIGPLLKRFPTAQYIVPPSTNCLQVPPMSSSHATKGTIPMNRRHLSSATLRPIQSQRSTQRACPTLMWAWNTPKN